MPTVEHDGHQHLCCDKHQHHAGEQLQQEAVLPQGANTAWQAKQSQQEAQHDEQKHGVRPDAPDLLLGKWLFADQAPHPKAKNHQTQHSERQVAQKEDVFEEVVH